MESYQKLNKDCSRSIEQDAPIGISKQHTNSKQKLKNSKTIWNVKNNKEIRRTQNENDQELLIFEEPMLMIPNDGILNELFLDVW